MYIYIQGVSKNTEFEQIWLWEILLQFKRILLCNFSKINVQFLTNPCAISHKSWHINRCGCSCAESMWHPFWLNCFFESGMLFHEFGILLHEWRLVFGFKSRGELWSFCAKIPKNCSNWIFLSKCCNQSYQRPPSCFCNSQVD